MEKLTIILVCLIQASCVTVAAADEFELKVNDNGSYKLFVDGQLWLENGPTFFNGYGKTWSTDSSKNPLVLRNVTKTSGGDVTEQWREIQFTYTMGNMNTSVVAAIRLYSGSIYSSRVLFTQTFPTGVLDTQSSSLSFDETLSGFPCFQVKNGSEPLGYLTYGGSMFGFDDVHMAPFDSKTEHINDGMRGGPLALFNTAGKAVVISPYNNFMAASVWHDGKQGGHVAWGIMSGVNELPEKFSYSTLLMFDTGINQAFQSWGFILSQQFGPQKAKERKMKIDNDLSLHYLGYWTDNGAYYYYHPETGKTFENTMFDVKKYADDNHIPYRYLQLDSWWYPKDDDGGVITWTPMKGIFPDGIKYISEKTKWPIAAHNRYWSKKTPYAKSNGGNFTFVMGEKASVPDDQTFWNYLLSQARNWGLFLYEQDWLYVSNRDVSALEKNLTLGRDWLMQMAQGAANNNQTIQYCMSYPRHAMQTLEFPVVTQARVSGDYLHTHGEQWRVGVSSIFARAMGIHPYKDTFWTTSIQPGNPYHAVEPYPALQAVVASLTTGPVGPSDMINGTNITLLMRCCRQDGRLLRPWRAATAIDKQIMTNAFRPKSLSAAGEVWSSQSIINYHFGNLSIQREYGLLLAADVTDRFSVSVNELGFHILFEGVYYPYNDWTKWQYFNSNTNIDLTGCSKSNFCLYYFAPLLNGTTRIQAILGEADKWVPMSIDRVDFVSIDIDTTVDLIFRSTEVAEKVNISYIVDNQLHTHECSLPAGVETLCTIYEP